jgi:hypothetical protein
MLAGDLFASRIKLHLKIAIASIPAKSTGPGFHQFAW